jgi:hypothetical protein
MSLTQFKGLDIYSHKSVDHQSKINTFQFKQINLMPLKTKRNRGDYN